MLIVVKWTVRVFLGAFTKSFLRHQLREGKATFSLINLRA
jgi:hypothetical protein